MKLPKAKSKERQRMLFETKKFSDGYKRVCIGDFFEEATAVATGAHRLRTDADADICPDLYEEVKNQYFEIKSVGQTRRAIIYVGRHDKEQRFDILNSLQYWFWCHDSKPLKAVSKAHLHHNLADKLTDVLVVDFPVVEKLLSAQQPRRLNSGYLRDGRRNGYGQTEKGYGQGWELPVAKVRSQCLVTTKIGPLQVYDQVIPEVTVRFIDRIRVNLRK